MLLKVLSDTKRPLFYPFIFHCIERPIYEERHASVFNNSDFFLLLCIQILWFLDFRFEQVIFDYLMIKLIEYWFNCERCLFHFTFVIIGYFWNETYHSSVSFNQFDAFFGHFPTFAIVITDFFHTYVCIEKSNDRLSQVLVENLTTSFKINFWKIT